MAGGQGRAGQNTAVYEVVARKQIKGDLGRDQCMIWLPWTWP